MKKLLLTSAFAAIAFMSVGARHRATTPPPLNIDFRRSLVLTDANDFVGITFDRVLKTLIDRSGATETTPLSPYRQWSDTHNPKPGPAAADARHRADSLAA